ncbi:MAG: PEGA domain-containing protein, partial [Lachnospiraceae bacterium]|nr:PEGA domain-containing protein [Lachnospiraceae bacterium]
KEGYLADITFLKSKKLLVSLKEAKASLVMEDTSGFSVDSAAKVLKYKSESYKLTEGTLLLGGGSRETVRDLKPEDVLTLVGEDGEVYAVTVKKGHGTLTLKGEDQLVGGTLSIGKDLSIHIIKGMEITLPEGEQTVSFVKGKTAATKTVTIGRNENTVLDVSDIEVEEAKTGKVLFNVTPENAEVYVDGALIDNTRLHEYGYGLHKLVASASGYETLTRYFKVAEPQASLPVTLEKTDDTTVEEPEEDKTEGYFIVISSPTGVEISFDGNYMGISPLSIKKVAGAHVISLHKNGYVSRSYNVNIENTAENVYYSFENMAEEKNEKKETTSSASGNNTVSGNSSNSVSGN